MKPDELPEDINNPKPQESGGFTPPIPSSLSDSPPISDKSEELIIPQDAATPEKVTIIESQIETGRERESFPPAAPATIPEITNPETEIAIAETVAKSQSEIETGRERESFPPAAPEQNPPAIANRETEIVVAETVAKSQSEIETGRERESFPPAAPATIPEITNPETEIAIAETVAKSQSEIETGRERESFPPAAPEQNPPAIANRETEIVVAETVAMMASEIETGRERESFPPAIANRETEIVVAETVAMMASEIETGRERESFPPAAPEQNPPAIANRETDIFLTSQGEKENLPAEVDAPMRIFITGASGCIGHYIVETLIEKTDYELFLLVRNPNQLKFDYNARPGIHIVEGDMREIKRFGQLLKTMNCAVLAAAAWGGKEAIDVNTFKTIQLLKLLNPKVCQHIIYFSTASVLNRQNQLLKEAGQAGTDYIRSKYDFLRQVNRVPIAKRMTTVFPTLVLGGDEKHPYSHISGGLPDLMKETEIIRFLDKPLLKVKPIDLIRFFQAEGSFHFIHARDIAQVVRYLIDYPPESQDSRWLVLGNEPVTINEVIEEACAYLNKPITHRFNLSPWLADMFIRLFRIEMSAWDRFSLDYRHFNYQNPVNPSTFGMPVYCPNIIDVLKLSGINGRR